MNPVVQETIDRCRAAGLRRTKALEELVSTLLESQRPMTLSELAASKRLTDLNGQPMLRARRGGKIESAAMPWHRRNCATFRERCVAVHGMGG